MAPPTRFPISGKPTRLPKSWRTEAYGEETELPFGLLAFAFGFWAWGLDCATDFFIMEKVNAEEGRQREKQRGDGINFTLSCEPTSSHETLP